jgi:hypothetical protein
MFIANGPNAMTAQRTEEAGYEVVGKRNSR